MRKTASPQVRSSLGLLQAVLLAALLLAPTPAGGQETAAPPAEPPVETAPAPPQPITITEVPGAAAKVLKLLRDLAPLLSAGKEEGKVREEYSLLGEDVATLGERPGSTDPEEAPPWMLDDLENEWRKFFLRLQGLEEIISFLASDMEAKLLELEAEHTVWALTQDSADEQEFPDALRESVATLLVSIKMTETELRARRDELLTLENEIATERLRVGGILERITSAQSEARQRIWAPDAPPLWQAFEVTHGFEGLREQISYAWDKNRRDLDDYARLQRDRFILHFFLTIALLAVMIVLARGARRWASEDSALQRPARVLAKPVSGTLVVSLTAGMLLHLNAEGVVYELFLLLLIVPLLRLLSSLVFREVRRPLYALSAIFVLDRVRALTPDESGLHRLLLVVTTGLALLVLLTALRGIRTRAKDGANRWLSSTLLLARVGVICLSVGLFANVIGSMSLAKILTNGVLISAYMAVAILAGVMVLDGALVVLIRTSMARRSNVVQRHSTVIVHRVSRDLHLVAAVLWLWVATLTFDIWPTVKTTAVAVFGRVWEIGTLDFSLWQLLAFVLVLFLSVGISRFTRLMLEEDVLVRMELPRGVGGTLSMLVRYAILTIGFFVAVSAAGIELSNFAIIVGALSVGIGFGLQNVVNNFVSGLILAFERPVQVGDTVEVGGLLGEVKNIGIRSSTVRTFDGAEVIVPNGDLISNQVTNWTLSDFKRRIKIPVGVAYGTDPSRVIEILNETASAHPAILTDPAPYTLFIGFGDSSLDFELRMWTLDQDRWLRIRSEVTVAICEALDEAEIEIPFPQRDLHLRSVDAEAAKTLGPDGQR